MDRRDPDGRDEGPWYETAILYAVDVRSFFDTDADGVGDLRGLLRKLDYLQELGVSGLWLLPFCPSPMRDHGHDVADHRGVHAQCGHMREFTALVREAHRRGIRVLVDFVLGHTSDPAATARNDSRAGKPITAT